MRKLSIEELDRLSTEEYKRAEKRPVIVVLDNVRSLNNVGSVFRTCDAFRIEKLCLCGITATPPHRDIQKTALGATESVEWEYYDDSLPAVKALKEKGYAIYSVEQADQSILLQNFSFPADKKLALVFGHEVRGVDQAIIDASDGCIEIPQFGTKHSFNISVSVGIVLWEILSGRE